MINFTDYGFMETEAPEAGMPARVVAVHKERYELICAYGQVFGRLKTSVYYGGAEDFPTTGDFVRIAYVENGDSQILKTLCRRTFFSRRDPTPGRGEQAVAANFDFVFIMQSLNDDFNEKRLERYLTLAWQSGAVPVVLLTKADLVEDCTEQVLAAQRIAMGADVVAVSAQTGDGMEQLEKYLQPRKTIVFLGSSGVGKSSLVNALTGQESSLVQTIREDDDKGRHTTTHRQLFMLKNGVMVIDTPGMRELGMWDVSEGLGQSFMDVEQYMGCCKFFDCKHQSEPGCAVKAAIQSGALSAQRWESYQKLKREARFTDGKSSKKQKNFEKYKKSDRKSRKVDLDE